MAFFLFFRLLLHMVFDLLCHVILTTSSISCIAFLFLISSFFDSLTFFLIFLILWLFLFSSFLCSNSIFACPWFFFYFCFNFFFPPSFLFLFTPHVLLAGYVFFFFLLLLLCLQALEHISYLYFWLALSFILLSFFFFLLQFAWFGSF